MPCTPAPCSQLLAITMRHLITLSDVTAAEIQRIFSITEDLKTKFGQGLREPLLPGRMLALLFEKQSLRTRVSFESGMVHLGGGSIMLGEDVGFGKRESVADFSRVLSEMVDVVVIRSKRHATVVEFAAVRIPLQHADLPEEPDLVVKEVLLDDLAVLPSRHGAEL